jgi:hypothetical protein
MPNQDDLEAARRLLNLNRRAFLRLLTMTGTTALLAACGARGSDPTPTPTRTPRPTLSPSATATGTAVPTLPPRATASPPVSPLAAPLSPPATPEPPAATTAPTNTPRPTATPFPPGPPSKLGLFVGRNDPRIREMLRTGNVALVKTLEYDPGFAEEIKQYAPKTLLVGRISLPQINLSEMNDPKGAAQAFVDQLLPIAGDPRRKAVFDGWEAYNEPVVDNAEQMGRLAAFEAERTRLLAAAGVRSVVGNFSTGTPALELWPQFRPAIEAVLATQGYLGLHEYSAPTMQWGTNQELLKWGVDPGDEGWHTLRYRKVYRGYLQPNKLEAPLLITETGIDGMITGHPGPSGKGWKDYTGYWEHDLHMGPGGPGNYMQQLAWYDAHLQQDKYVLGAAIFAAAPPSDWQSFEILNDVEPILRQYFSVHAPR